MSIAKKVQGMSVSRNGVNYNGGNDMTKEEARVEMQKCNEEIMNLLNDLGNGGDVEEIAVKSAAMRIRLNECFAVLCTKEI